MFQLIQNSGLVGFLLIGLGVWCAVLVVKSFLRLQDGGKATIQASRRSLLFWGVLALLLGFVGHTVGVFKAMSVILESEMISGEDVALALRASMSTVILGLSVFIVAAIGWLSLGALATSAKGSSPG